MDGVGGCQAQGRLDHEIEALADTASRLGSSEAVALAHASRPTSASISSSEAWARRDRRPLNLTLGALAAGGGAHADAGILEGDLWPRRRHRLEVDLWPVT